MTEQSSILGKWLALGRWSEKGCASGVCQNHARFNCLPQIPGATLADRLMATNALPRCLAL